MEDRNTEDGTDSGISQFIVPLAPTPILCVSSF